MGSAKERQNVPDSGSERAVKAKPGVLEVGDTVQKQDREETEEEGTRCAFVQGLIHQV